MRDKSIAALFFFLGAFLSSFSYVYSQDVYYGDDNACCYICQPPKELNNRLSIGPEIYHIRRTRAGGTKQTGPIYAVRGYYDRIKPFGVYVGGDFLYGRGTIDGRSGQDDALKSTFTDERVEARLGFTLQAKMCYTPTITPFVGYGYMRETNKYRAPSPMEFRFQNKGPFASFGFLSSFKVSPRLDVGFNFKGMNMLHVECIVSDDPEFDDLKLMVEEKINYRFEIPFYYEYFILNKGLNIGIIPFYETRHYGGRENFPFNFLDTKLKIFGVSFQLTFWL